MLNAKLGYELEIGLDRTKAKGKKTDNPNIEYDEDEDYYYCSSCGESENNCNCEYYERDYKKIKKAGFEVETDCSLSHSGKFLPREIDLKELKSKVYDISKNGERDKIYNDFKTIEPYLKESNKTMGLHFHISFNDDDLNYLKLCNYDFVEKFTKAYLENFKGERQISRLINRFSKGYNSKTEFNKVLKRQLAKDNNKFYAVNYCSYFRFKTIEFRVFPSTDNFKQFKKYIVFLLKFIDNYLSNYKIKNINKYSRGIKNKMDIKTKNEIIEVKI